MSPDGTIPAEQRERIVGDLLAWYGVHKRDLPWRGASAYAVWISEIMLQQTQVVTVIPFFLRFLERFPTVEALAEAPIEEVLKYWAGLGYYARARNLHRAAQLVVAEHGGRIPDTPELIETLPGIGRYTSGAILSIAYNVPRPLVDANVIRVLSRLFGLHGDPKSTPNQTQLWALATQLVEGAAHSPGDFNQGLMELGALICEPNEPKCDRCPLLRDCVAGNSPDPSTLPELPPNRPTISVTHSAAILRNADGELLIVQRPLHGLWGGLWEFPRVVCATRESPTEAALRAARELLGPNTEFEVGTKIARIKHSVTHHRITLYAFEVIPVAPLTLSADKIQENRINYPNHAVESPPNVEQESCATQQDGTLIATARWEALDALQNYAFSSPQALLREALTQHRQKKSVEIQPVLF